MVVVYYIFPYRYHSRGKFIIICSNKSKHWKKEINTVTEMMLFFGLLLKCLPHRTCFLLQVIYLTQLLLSQPVEEASWERAVSIKEKFPNFCLEDEATFIGGGIDRNLSSKWDRPFKTYQPRPKQYGA